MTIRAALQSVVVGLIILLFIIAADGKPPENFVFYGSEREMMKSDKMLDNEFFSGAQISYFWKQLETAPDEYDFSAIREDIKFLAGKGKRLWIQVQDVTFSSERTPAPRYLQADPKYHGGVSQQYDSPSDDDTKAVPEGWVVRRWDPSVQERLHKLYAALGKAFDGKVAGINLAETSLTFGSTGKLYPPGFTPAIYRDSVIANMRSLKKAFPHTTVMQYANFMPSEWKPADNKGYLDAVYDIAAKEGIAVGGPDLLPFRKGQLGHSYPLLKKASAKTKTGIAVQDGNYNEPDPKSGQAPTISELVEFATESLGVSYMFWCTEQPFYSRDLAAYIRSRKEK